MSKKEEIAPIIIVKKHGKHKHAHHGGSWKVAFADFATAMMAFFLVMWLLGGTSDEEKQEIAGYFMHPEEYLPIHRQSEATIIIDNKNPLASKLTPDNVKQMDITFSVEEAQEEMMKLTLLKESLEKAVEESAGLEAFKDQILIESVPEGLRIQLMDKENQSMFQSGSERLEDKIDTLLKKLAEPINQMGNKISITGHTDAKPFTLREDYSNWELSSERANAARRALVRGGLKEDKVSKIVGVGPTDLFDPKIPDCPCNRRISIIVLKKTIEELHENQSHKVIQLPALP